jgi:hypothetical protein
MTGTNCDLFTHKSSRSYLNHLVIVIRVQEVQCEHLTASITHFKSFSLFFFVKLVNVISWSPCQQSLMQDGQYLYTTVSKFVISLTRI